MKIKIESMMSWEIEKFSSTDWRAYRAGSVITEKEEDAVLRSLGLEDLLEDIATYELGYMTASKEAEHTPYLDQLLGGLEISL